jgi:hypothetical protein
MEQSQRLSDLTADPIPSDRLPQSFVRDDPIPIMCEVILQVTYRKKRMMHNTTLRFYAGKIVSMTQTQMVVHQ